MPADLRQLTNAEWDQLQDRADRYATALWRGDKVDFDSFLPKPGDHLRYPVLVELVKIDLDFQWQNGKKPVIEEYAERISELGQSDDWPAHLITEEFRVRMVHGDRPTIESYQKRFPHRFEEIEPSLRTMYIPGKRADGSMRASSKPEASAPAPEGPRTLANGYILVEVLGAGHFGQVWRALAPGGVEVAVKELMQPADQESAQRELQALELVKTLRHTCLLQTQAFWTENNRLYVAMELADGSLRDRMKQCRDSNLSGIPPDELLVYFRDAAEGLDFLHSRKVLHRDIKPDNILLLAGHAKVADFGLARHQTRALMSVSYAGTPVYMAPEVWGGKAGEPSDLYSLAFAYAELRTGKRPLDGADFVEVMTRHLEQPPNLADMAPAEAAVVRQALAKKPDQRYPSCLDFIYALEQALGPEMSRGRWRPPVVTRAGKTVENIESHDTHLNTSLATSNDNWPVLDARMSATRNDAPPPSQTATREVPSSLRNRPVPTRKSNRKTLAIAGVAGLMAVLIGTILVLLLSQPGEPTTQEPPKDRDTVTLDIDDRVKAVFIRVKPKTGLPEYYLLQRKMTNDQFRAAGGSPPLGGSPDAPVTGISWDDADRVAKSMKGKLPSPEQWDAAFHFDPEGKHFADLGKGREMTSETVGDHVVVRGHFSWISAPLTADYLKSSARFTHKRSGSAESGFRVVLDNVP